MCITYDGDQGDLEGLILTGSTKRKGAYLESNIPLEEVEGESCFELVDANYVSVTSNAKGGRLIFSEDPLSIKINAASEDRELTNNEQTIDLGQYIQFPFLEWIYPEGNEAGCAENYHSREDPVTNEEIPYPAWDFIPKPTDEYPTIVGTPVLAPVSGISYYYIVNSAVETNTTPVNTIRIYSSDTGFLVNLTHEYALVELDGKWTMLEEFNGKDVTAGQQIGIIGPQDWASTMPHTHLQVLIPPEQVDFT